MNIAETLRGLRRRWYIVVPGLLLAVALAAGAWMVVKPGYERTATLLLLPGSTSVPAGGNPYLYIGGLTQAADVVVTAVGSDNVLGALTEEYPGLDVQVTRDPSTSGPQVLITVMANADQQAEDALNTLVSETSTILAELQDQENIPVGTRISVNPITVDTESTLQQKNRVTIAAGVGVGVVVLTVLLAALVEGFVSSRRRRRSPDSSPSATLAVFDDELVEDDADVPQVPFPDDAASREGDVVVSAAPGSSEPLSSDTQPTVTPVSGTHTRSARASRSTRQRA